MKIPLKLTVIAIMALFLFTNASATEVMHSTCYTVTLMKVAAEETDPFHVNDTQRGHRLPSRPIECTISQETGVSIYDCPDEIVSYEIWDADGNSCLTLCSEESDFLNDLFSLTGDFQIRFNSSDYTYVGYILTSNVQ